MLSGGDVDRVPFMPITMMFAADQTGARYRQYVSDHRVMVEAQIRTAELFGCDQVSGISDPTREACDLGATLAWFDDQPPAMVESDALLKEKGDLLHLKRPDPLGGGRMHDRVCAMAMFRKRVGREKLVEGWIEGPCNQGSNLRGINTLMLDFYDDPAFVRDLFDFVVELEVAFGRAQFEAGADLIGMGDPAASLVGPAFYAEFVAPSQKRIVDALHAVGAKVRLHICGHTRKMFADIGGVGADIVDLDSMAPVSEAREMMGPHQVLLGNVDPVRTLLRGTPDFIRAEVAECYRQAGSRYIVGAGCEVPRGTPGANLRALRECALAAAR